MHDLAERDVPATPSAADNSAVELGVKFRADEGWLHHRASGSTRAPATPAPTRAPVDEPAGTMLATVTFTGETATGWQQATFGAPVPVTANTTYVASYHAPVGRYAFNSDYFATGGDDPRPAHRAARTAPTAATASTGTAPAASRPAPYPVQQLLGRRGFRHDRGRHHRPDGRRHNAGAGLQSEWPSAHSVTRPSPRPVISGSVTMELRRPDNTLVPATLGVQRGDPDRDVHADAPLAASTTYTATVERRQRRRGQHRWTPVTWSFTTAARLRRLRTKARGGRSRSSPAANPYRQLPRRDPADRGHQRVRDH